MNLIRAYAIEASPVPEFVFDPPKLSPHEPGHAKAAAGWLQNASAAMQGSHAQQGVERLRRVVAAAWNFAQLFPGDYAVADVASIVALNAVDDFGRLGEVADAKDALHLAIKLVNSFPDDRPLQVRQAKAQTNALLHFGRIETAGFEHAVTRMRKLHKADPENSEIAGVLTSLLIFTLSRPEQSMAEVEEIRNELVRTVRSVSDRTYEAILTIRSGAASSSPREFPLNFKSSTMMPYLPRPLTSQ